MELNEPRPLESPPLTPQRAGLNDSVGLITASCSIFRPSNHFEYVFRELGAI